MPNPFYSQHPETSDVRGKGPVPDKRPAAKPPGLSRQPWKMPKAPGPGRRVHKVQGRRVRQMAREDF